MITDLKLIKEGRNYVIKFFNQRPKTLENYGSLLVALDEVAKSIEEEYIKVAQKIIDLGIDTPVYIKEQKKWIVPEIINDSIMKIMIIDRDDYKQLSNNPIEIKDNILKVKDIKKIIQIICQKKNLMLILLIIWIRLKIEIVKIVEKIYQNVVLVYQ
jgi:hypothetical protein